MSDKTLFIYIYLRFWICCNSRPFKNNNGIMAHSASHLIILFLFDLEYFWNKYRSSIRDDNRVR